LFSIFEIDYLYGRLASIRFPDSFGPIPSRLTTLLKMPLSIVIVAEGTRSDFFMIYNMGLYTI
jgi:hypothetical protein